MKDKRKTAGYIIGFVVLVSLCIAAGIWMPRLSASRDTIAIGHSQLPVSTLTGVLSSLANIAAILLVVFYRKQGFIAALIIILTQVPFMIRNIAASGSMIGLPGMFGTLLTIVVLILIRSRDKSIDKYQQDRVKQLEEQQKQSERLFEQTARALVTAIDAKDEYSHGHSMRVAEYSRRIAQLMGKSEEECRKVYYAGLLHDVGKIGIPDAIINKKSELTPEEHKAVEKHPELSNQILSSIQDYPYISIGAHYHHERYDGKGYPDGLKGEDIPEIARIISVADAYDTMSSNRSYRQAIPQQIIREEIVAGAGSQFDPEIAMIMRHMIDLDTEYQMKEGESVRELAGSSVMRCGEYRNEISDGIRVQQEITRIHLEYRDEAQGDDVPGSPAIILFDSLDARVHDDPQTVRNLDYYEYCEIWLDGKTVNHGVRKIETNLRDAAPAAPAEAKTKTACDIEAVKCKDHVLIRISCEAKTAEITVALPDSSRYAYIALTGRNCLISGVHIDKAEEKVPDDYIPRIAEEISYIRVPAGDLPNVQIDSIRSASTEGVPVTDGMRLTFHAMSLPTARLIWHCPYVVLFTSENGKVNGPGYREYAVTRLDGENWEDGEGVRSRIHVNREDDFEGWDAWKAGNKAGYDCSVLFSRAENKITVSTKNLGLSVRSTVTLPEDGGTVYAALTGDQCALTNIRIVKP